LLAVLQLQHVLRTKDPRDIDRALKTMPTAPEKAYEEIFDRIDSHDVDSKVWIYKILSWIFHAKRDLNMGELVHALVVRPNDETLKDDSFSPPKYIVEDCQSLITYDEKTRIVRFSHFTVEQFIRSNRTQHLLPVVELAKTCLTYLSFQGIERETDAELPDHYMFFGYAAKYWASHCRGDAEQDFIVQKAIFKLLASENKMKAILQTDDDVFDGSQTLLHVIAKNGLATICGLVLDVQQPQRSIAVFKLGDFFLFLKNLLYDLKEATYTWLYPLHDKPSLPETYLPAVVIEVN
jgi:hypothetical protein